MVVCPRVVAGDGCMKMRPFCSSRVRGTTCSDRKRCLLGQVLKFSDFILKRRRIFQRHEIADFSVAAAVADLRNYYYTYVQIEFFLHRVFS
jgi:hypothetical protein